jgi:putative ABC transport system permease protein
VAQLATALMLITGAGVVARTFWRVTSLDVGFRADHLLVAQLNLPRARYDSATAPPFFEELLTRVRRESGVAQAAMAAVPPVGGLEMSMSSTDSTGKTTPRVDVVSVGAGYLETIGARLVQGRLIEPTDRAGTPKVAVITETAARLLFPDGNAVGRALPFHGLIVVGIVKDIRQRELEAAPGPGMYLAATQNGARNRMALMMRTSGRPEALEAAVRRAVRAMDPALPAPTLMTMEQKLAEAVAPRRFTFLLLGLFALLAGSLAVVGLYGVLAYLVADRTREIGIRIALGADVSRVRRIVIAQGMGLTAIGVALGLAGSILAAGTLKTMVYEVSVYDRTAFVAAAILLMVVAYIACYVPARRASRVDPIMALRAE